MQDFYITVHCTLYSSIAILGMCITAFSELMVMYTGLLWVLALNIAQSTLDSPAQRCNERFL